MIFENKIKTTNKHRFITKLHLETKVDFSYICNKKVQLFRKIRTISRLFMNFSKIFIRMNRYM